MWPSNATSCSTRFRGRRTWESARFFSKIRRPLNDLFAGGESLQIRMVAGYWEPVDRKEQLIAEACNHPNCLVLPFRLELIRLVT